MMDRFQRSWQLVKASYNVLRQDKELLVFPLVSLLASIVVFILFMIPFIGTGIIDALTQQDGQSSPIAVVLGVIVLFLFYFVTYTVVIFSNTALIGAAMIRLDGGDPTVADGFRIASERFGKILGYAAIAATVGVILNTIRSQSRESGVAGAIIGSLLAGVLEFAWNIITFLVVPVLVVENIGPIEAIKRSGQLLKKTWGEQLIANFGIGAVLGLATLGIILLGVVLTALLSVIGTVGIILGITVTVIAVIALSLFGGALGGIYQAALYRYAAQGVVSSEFDAALIQGAFTRK